MLFHLYLLKAYSPSDSIKYTLFESGVKELPPSLNDNHPCVSGVAPLTIYAYTTGKS